MHKNFGQRTLAWIEEHLLVNGGVYPLRVRLPAESREVSIAVVEALKAAGWAVSGTWPYYSIQPVRVWHEGCL